jgi:hypothetical protein
MTRTLLVCVGISLGLKIPGSLGTLDPIFHGRPGGGWGGGEQVFVWGCVVEVG